MLTLQTICELLFALVLIHTDTHTSLLIAFRCGGSQLGFVWVSLPVLSTCTPDISVRGLVVQVGRIQESSASHPGSLGVWWPCCMGWTHTEPGWSLPCTRATPASASASPCQPLGSGGRASPPVWSQLLPPPETPGSGGFGVLSSYEHPAFLLVGR